jgi:hypothetical protein
MLTSPVHNEKLNNFGVPMGASNVQWPLRLFPWHRPSGAVHIYVLLDQAPDDSADVA